MANSGPGLAAAKTRTQTYVDSRANVGGAQLHGRGHYGLVPAADPTRGEDAMNIDSGSTHRAEDNGGGPQ
jgi:hypothetical protein